MLRSEQLEREAEARRIELANTFDELRARATPGHMLDRLVDYASDSGGVDFFRNLRDQTVANPLALGLVGAGLAWLMMGSRDGRRRYYDPYAYDEMQPSRTGMRSYLAGARERASGAVSSAMSGAGSAVSGAGNAVTGAAQGVSQAVSGARHFVSDTAAGMRDRVAGAAHTASDFASGTAGSIASTARRARDTAFDAASSLGERAGDTTAAVGDAASTLYGGVSQTAGRTASGVRALASGTASTGRDVFDFARDQPLVLAGLGLAFGAVMGAAFRSTQTERQLMGETSDELKERGYALATENYDKSKSMAGTVYEEFQKRVLAGGQSDDGGSQSPSSSSSQPLTGRASLVPLEEEMEREVKDKTMRPERIGPRDGRS